tara:strand:- start:3252 stop:3554 length:303 start_codon:yes stop_codon:yes gene_type:complete
MFTVSKRRTVGARCGAGGKALFLTLRVINRRYDFWLLKARCLREVMPRGNPTGGNATSVECLPLWQALCNTHTEWMDKYYKAQLACSGGACSTVVQTMIL